MRRGARTNSSKTDPPQLENLLNMQNQKMEETNKEKLAIRVKMWKFLILAQKGQ